MKKIAFFVEGQTELFFLNKLLIEIAGTKNVLIKLIKLRGKGTSKSTDEIFPKTLAQGSNTVNHTVLIYDCGGDESVKSRILEEYQDLLSDGFSEIIGLRDLYPLTNLIKLENILANGFAVGGKQVAALPLNTKIIVAVREIEDWFLADCNHYTCIDEALLTNLIVASMGFNPCVDDLTVRSISAADDLKSIYNLVGKSYNKKADNVERTIECLDYANIYLNLSLKIPKLNELISQIDTFLT
jgi:hypothetical protein